MISSTTLTFCREDVGLEVVVEAGKTVPLSNISFYFPLAYQRRFLRFLTNLSPGETVQHFESPGGDGSFASSVEMFLERSWTVSECFHIGLP